MVELDFMKGKRFAGPGTKLAYEAALGQFLVAVNSVENEVRDILYLSHKELEREDV